MGGGRGGLFLLDCKGVSIVQNVAITNILISLYRFMTMIFDVLLPQIATRSLLDIKQLIAFRAVSEGAKCFTTYN